MYEDLLPYNITYNLKIPNFVNGYIKDQNDIS